MRGMEGEKKLPGDLRDVLLLCSFAHPVSVQVARGFPVARSFLSIDGFRLHHLRGKKKRAFRYFCTAETSFLPFRKS